VIEIGGPSHLPTRLLMASHLPANVEDARIVLKLLIELVDNFLAEPEPERGANVVTLSSKGDGR
jgi:hypothetical protein